MIRHRSRGWFASLVNRATTRPAARRRPRLEMLEGRELMATLGPIANQTVYSGVGLVLPLSGGSSNQTFQATSTNANIKANIVQGSILKIDVNHQTNAPGDVAFSGSLVFQLFDQLTPTTVARITSLVTQGFYTSPTTNNTLTSKNFHRVASGFPGASDFIVQGGSPNGDGTGEVNQPGFPFDDEFVASLVFTGSGQLAMANAGDDTNSSQFFVTTGQPRFLDFNHTIFGQLIDGFDTLSQMTQVTRNANDAPVQPILITGTTLLPGNPNGTLLIDATAAPVGQTATVTVVATDPANNTTQAQSFQVTAAANTSNERPFLTAINPQFVGVNQTLQFALPTVNTDPNDALSYAVGGSIVNNAFVALPSTTGTATVSPNGVVTFIPATGFSGQVTLVVGVRDQIERVGTNLSDSRNYDTQRVTVTVSANNVPTATPLVGTTQQNVAASLQLAGNPGDPSQTLTFNRTSNPSHGTISNFNSSTGTFTYTPAVNFQGTDSFTFTVTDVGPPTPNLTSTQATVTINVQPGTVINVAPTALPGSATVYANLPSTLQLIGNSGNPESNQAITYAIVTPPTKGTITSIDPATGLVVYTPFENFIGTDTFTFRTTDVGAPLPNLSSSPATFTINVTGTVNTGAVRQIGDVLIVTPLPKRLRDRTPNTIRVTEVDGRLTVVVNGQIDQLRPQAIDISRLVVYGAKVGDQITVSDAVSVPATLNGGQGGNNRIKGGSLPSRLHGWFGKNRLEGGPDHDALIGRQGRVRFIPSEGNDLLFAGDPSFRPQLNHSGKAIPPTGTFYRFVSGRLVEIGTPGPRYVGRTILHPNLRRGR